MNAQDRGFDTLVPPWDDQELLEEQDAIDRMHEVVEAAVACGAKDAARLAVIAIGNYVWQSQDWPKFVEAANTALDKLEDKLSRRWG